MFGWKLPGRASWLSSSRTDLWQAEMALKVIGQRYDRGPWQQASQTEYKHPTCSLMVHKQTHTHTHKLMN